MKRRVTTNTFGVEAEARRRRRWQIVKTATSMCLALNIFEFRIPLTFAFEIYPSIRASVQADFGGTVYEMVIQVKMFFSLPAIPSF